MRVEEFLTYIETLLLVDRPRMLIGLAGKPGAGKSTLADIVKNRFPGDKVAIISLDGYHLSNEILEDRGIRNRKGAPDTFDQVRFAELLQSVKMGSGEIRFPIFHREIEESVADEGIIPAAARIVLVEGNYLLSTDFGWERIADLLDLSYYLELDDSVRVQRLIARHERFGKSSEEARAWAMGTDEANANFIERDRHRATGVIEI